jgi:hypothetical protein
MKGFIDRIYSFYVPEFWMKDVKSRLPGGKKILFVLTQGNGDESLYGDIASKYAALVKVHGFDEDYLLRVCGASPAGNILEDSKAVAQADELAKAIMK